MNKIWIVYMHIFPNNKKYIGITSKSAYTRWGNNGAHYKSQKFVYNAITKYGWDNIIHVIVADKLSENDAKELEKLLIKAYNTTDVNYGYNITQGGDGILGYHHTNMTKLKISKSNIGKHTIKHSDKTKEKISKALKGKKKSPLSEEHKLKLREQALGKKFGPRPEYVKRAIGDANRGRVMSDEQKVKLSKAHKGKKFSEETKQKMREAQRNRRYREKIL